MMCSRCVPTVFELTLSRAAISGGMASGTHSWVLASWCAPSSPLLAKRGTPLNDLPEANVLQKTDIVPGAERGMLIGGIAGLLGGILVVLSLPAASPCRSALF